MNWGKSIVLVFVLFISFVGIMAYKMATAKVDLVQTNYYQTELDYQKQFEKMQNSASLKPSEIISYSPEKQMVKITFPQKVIIGAIYFYRSSDNKLDKNVIIQNTSQFEYSTKNMTKGNWKIEVSWGDGKNEYFIDQHITLK